MVIRRLWSKPIFSLFFAKTFLGNQKMDIYKCPKLVLPKKSWQNKKYAILNINSQKDLKPTFQKQKNIGILYEQEQYEAQKYKEKYN